MDRVVVGVDGSPNGDMALRWGAAEAGRHGAALVAVMAWGYLDQHHADKHEGFDAPYGEEEARDALRAYVDAVVLTGVVEQHAICDVPARALIDASEGSDLLVLGARGLGGFKGLLLGSVSERVLEHARCPVALLRAEDTGPADGPVVVGVDGSETSTRALQWAAREARVRHAPLHVVHAWETPAVALPTARRAVKTIEDAARTVLDRAQQDPALAGLDVEGHLSPLSPAEAVLELAHGASLIVAGSRGLGRVGRMLLGSTSRQLAHHAPCPIVIVPPSQSRETEPDQESAGRG